MSANINVVCHLPIEGYEGRYEVTDDGRIWSVKNEIFLKQAAGGRKDDDGDYVYSYVSLYRKQDDEVVKATFTVHKLVARAFAPIPDGPDKVEVDHRNGDTFDNRACNLRWLTHAQNLENRVMYKNNTSGTTGVFKSKNRWRARIGTPGTESCHEQFFKTEAEAIAKRSEWNTLYHPHNCVC